MSKQLLNGKEGMKRMSESDLGMIYIAQLHLVAKVHADSKGKFVKIPRFGKCYIEMKV